MKTSFSIDLYDEDGDVYETGIYLHIDPNIILKFKDSEDLRIFAKEILEMIPEINENENCR